MPPTGSGSFGQSHPQPEGFLPFLLEDRFVPLLLGRRVEHRPGPVGFGVIHELQRVAADKELSFSFDFDENPVMLAIREQDAQRLFGNLISNAVRYASKEIRLSCHSSGESAIIRVADDGPGIAEEDLPHVFERFYKGKDGKHGIGLAIAQSVAEAYQGTLTARNENGAVFEAAFRI